MSERCQALASSGRQCRVTGGLRAEHYHGDGELYDYSGPMPGWVKVWLCMKHRKPTPRKVRVSK